VVAAAVVVGVAVSARPSGTAPPGGPALTPAAFVSGPGTESSAWYCTGQTTPAGAIAVGTLVLTNTTGRIVRGVITSTSETGAQVLTSVVVPPHGQLVPSAPAPSSGAWVAQEVVLGSGGVAVTQAVHGTAGWSEAPCASQTSQQWYFASGVTTGSDGLFISVFNPTSTPDVVDMTFVTPGGVVHPIDYQGLVIGPGQLQVANVGAFVQDQAAVSATVSSRTGRIVATEVQQFSSYPQGLSVLPGVPATASNWSIPQSEEINGGASELDIYNPGSTAETVTVTAHPLSGPVAPIVQRVGPFSTWALSTSSQTRLPKTDLSSSQPDPYSTEVSARGGSGVVVGRLVAGPASGPQPRAGLAAGVTDLTTSWPSRQWLVPSPGSTLSPAHPGVLPEHLALSDPTDASEHYVVLVMTPHGTRAIASGTLQPHQGVSLGGSTLFGAGLYSLLVRGSGPLSVSEDVGPAGAFGVVTMPGLAMSAG
jgi:hypothetical protein